jgi:hypothetical protein
VTGCRISLSLNPTLKGLSRPRTGATEIAEGKAAPPLRHHCPAAECIGLVTDFLSAIAVIGRASTPFRIDLFEFFIAMFSPVTVLPGTTSS